MALRCQGGCGIAVGRRYLVITPPRRFWGNQLRHFTQPNDTGSTRVSFDLRCVPLSLFVHDWKVSGK